MLSELATLASIASSVFLPSEPMSGRRRSAMRDVSTSTLNCCAGRGCLTDAQTTAPAAFPPAFLLIVSAALSDARVRPHPYLWNHASDLDVPGVYLHPACSHCLYRSFCPRI
jgi:hypothetical protein